MSSNAEKGLATGSKLYGYRTEPGGRIDIVEDEATVIRRIFAAYVAGETAREIALALNDEGVFSPRGGLWNASTIVGSRQRANGILNTHQYIGVKVWGRMEVRKDRATGKRLPKMFPESDWKRTPVPHLRIIDDETWAKVRARKDRASAAPQQAQRRLTLFSGLLKCGVCGGTYTTYTTGKITCTNYRERGSCTNRRTPLRSDIEKQVLQGLRDQLLSPEAVASYVRAYREQAAARKSSLQAQRAPLERRLAEIDRASTRVVDAIVRGVSNGLMEAKLSELELEKARLLLDLEEAQQDAGVVELHPLAAQGYARMVRELQETLDDLARGDTLAERQLKDEVRALVERVDIIPLTQDRGGPIDVVIHGKLAKFAGDLEHHRNPGLGVVVAGGGIEPPTCGL